jgi:enamine deaminase RidA (YjgF/YER057c/UK114 family)
MSRSYINHNTAFENDGAFSRVVVQEPFCFVSGTTGYDYTAMELPPSLAQQTNNCITNIEACLNEAGFRFQDIIRATYILADMKDADPFFAIIRPKFLHVKPAIQLFQARLYKPEMRVSIDVIACRCST